LPKKKDVALALLEQASVFVHLDPRTDKVAVPAWLKRQPQLVLQIGLNMAIPIPDLEVDEAGLSCTLSFNRSPHHCQIPWGAVFALVGDNGRGMVWPDDVPPEVAAEAEKQAKAAQAKAKLAPVPAPAPAAEAPVEVSAKAQAEAVVAKPARGKKVAAAAGEKKVAASGGAKAAASAPKREAKETKKPRAPRKRKPVPAATRAAIPAAAPAPEPARTATVGAASAPPKRKRELPPYLRIVK
jgi:stringent starvation protein B